MNTIERVLDSGDLQSKRSEKDRRESKNPKTELHMLLTAWVERHGAASVEQHCGTSAGYGDSDSSSKAHGPMLTKHHHLQTHLSGKIQDFGTESSALMLC